MDPITYLHLVPAEFMVPMLILAFAYKAWQLWILRDKDDDDVTPALG
jgi:hypothetical protein